MLKMARGVNKVIIVGNCGSDPEIKYMPNGGAVANITVATSESWKDKNTGQQQEKTEWHRVVFYGRLAEIVGQYVKRGSKIYLEGSLQTSSWEKDGIKRYSTDIKASVMQMLDSKGDNQGGQQQQQQQQRPQQQQQQGQVFQQQQYPQQQQQQYPQQPVPQVDDFDDDVPF